MFVFHSNYISLPLLTRNPNKKLSSRSHSFNVCNTRKLLCGLSFTSLFPHHILVILLDCVNGMVVVVGRASVFGPDAYDTLLPASNCDSAAAQQICKWKLYVCLPFCWHKPKVRLVGTKHMNLINSSTHAHKCTYAKTYKHIRILVYIMCQDEQNQNVCV